jgi:hypothetical protein
MSGGRIAPDDLARWLVELWAAEARGACREDEALAAYLDPASRDDERAAFEHHLQGCAECRAVVAAHARTAGEWTGAVARPPRAGWLRAWLTVPRLLSAAAAACLLVVATVWLLPDSPETDGLRAKGAWQFFAAAEVEGRTFRLEDDSRLPTGARLGFFYSAERAGQLMVLYADEQGEVVRLVPGQSDRSLAVVAGNQVRLADGARTSPGQGCEWVVAMFSERSFSEGEARQAFSRMRAARQGCRLEPRMAELAGVDVQVIRVLR